MNAATTANSGAAILENPAPSNPHQDYFNQIYLAPPTICGRTLKPLSIGRYRRLRRFNVAFVSDVTEEATARDLLIGVLICSMSKQEFIDLLSSPQFEKHLDKWGSRFGFFPPKCFSWPLIGRFIYWLGGRGVDLYDADCLLKGIQQFHEYVKDNSKSPKYWEESHNGSISGAHWSQSIETVLRGKLHWTPEEIEEEPLNKAVWDYYKYFEGEGLIRLMTADEINEQNQEASPEEIAAENAWVESLKEKGATCP